MVAGQKPRPNVAVDFLLALVALMPPVVSDSIAPAAPGFSALLEMSQKPVANEKSIVKLVQSIAGSFAGMGS